MPDPERHYNINKLNVLFAIAAVFLLMMIGLMFKTDYDREWKEYQEDFLELEIEKTRVKYDAELTALEQEGEYQQLKEELEKAQQVYTEQCAELEAVNGRIRELQTEDEIYKQRYRVRKAKLDAVKSEVEHARATGHEDVAVAQEYEQLTRETEALNEKILGLAADLKKEQTVIEDCGRTFHELEREKRRLAMKATLLERKLETIDPYEMSFLNEIANIVRDFPILDLSNPKYKIRQVVLKDLPENNNFADIPRVDRCMTCHLGIDNPDYADEPQPFTTHPNLELYIAKDSAHPVEEFGCTVCHNGRGRGTDFTSSAHMPADEAQAEEWAEKYDWHEMHHWENPMYPMPYIEASCLKCHSGQTAIKEAEKLNTGLMLIEKAGCYACHDIEKYQDWPKPGPSLAHMAAKVSKEWAYRWIENPHEFRHSTWMPAFFNQTNTSDPESVRRSKQEIHAIVEYLFQQSAPYELEKLPVRGDPKRGEEIVASVGCFGCHKIAPEPESTTLSRDSLLREQGPNLIGLGAKTSREWLFNWLKDPYRYHAGTQMPDLRLTDQEAADVTEFLMKGTAKEFSSGPVPPVEEAVLDEVILGYLQKEMPLKEGKERLGEMDLNEKLLWTGEKLIGHYGCYSCHDIKGFENYKPIGTDLTAIGSKPADKLDFGFVEIEHSRTAWLIQKLSDPRIFDVGKIKVHEDKLRMPNFYFTDEEIQAVTTALLGFVDEKPAKIKPRTTENLYIEEGQKLIRQFNCQGCHLIEGEGGAIQEKVAEWLVKYQNRGADEARALIGSFSPPNLLGEGARVQSRWLFEFIHEPVTIRPWLSVRMPTYGNLNAEQLNTIVKYFAALDNVSFPFDEVTDMKISAEEFEAGQKLFSSEYFSCTQCHIVGDKMPAGDPENWAPDFALARDRLRHDWIVKFIKDPQAVQPGTKMPTFFDPSYYEDSGPEDILGGNEDKQIKALRDYILTLAEPQQKKAQPPTAKPAPQSGNSQSAPQEETGY